MPETTAGLRVRLARLLLRGSGWTPMPARLTRDMRLATWLAQYEHARDRSVPDAPEGAPGTLALQRTDDPIQAAQDDAAYAAMVGLASGALVLEVFNGKQS